MIYCIIIDDEPFARKLLAEYIEKVPFLNLKGDFSSPLDALPAMDEGDIDLLFLDIQMPDLNGIDFLKVLRSRPSVIFTTAYKEFALEGYELDVVDYLLKPFDFSRFMKSVEKVRSLKEPAPTPSANGKPYVFLKESHQLVKVELEHICYIKGLKDYLRIITKDQQHIVLQTMKALQEKLPAHQFVRIHNSYIINMDQIEAVLSNQVKIKGELIPIGATYKKYFLEMLRELEL